MKKHPSVHIVYKRRRFITGHAYIVPASYPSGTTMTPGPLEATPIPGPSDTMPMPGPSNPPSATSMVGPSVMRHTSCGSQLGRAPLPMLLHSYNTRNRKINDDHLNSNTYRLGMEGATWETAKRTKVHTVSRTEARMSNWIGLKSGQKHQPANGG
jgi:hypothetical protein